MAALPKVKTNIQLKGMDLLTLSELNIDEIMYLLNTALYLKKASKSGKHSKVLDGQTLAMIFDKPSTRTRVSFEVGMTQLGGHALFLNSNDLQLGRGETIADTAKVLSQYADAIMIRTFAHSTVEELALHAKIPVINGLTDQFHPCQALADLLTIYETNKTFEDVKLVYVGDGNNVAHSLMIASAKVGLDCVIACPKGYEPESEIFKLASQFAKESGASIDISHDPYHAIEMADFVYTDVWASMGQEKEQAERLQVFQQFQVNENLIKKAKSNFKFLHCLPAHRGEEVTAEIIDGNHSVVFEQAANRLHVQKALLQEILS
ncbi:ornithine carbamoyltransferase [Cytobacillus sp. IB215316]|uniref:ornithine carbamoyltransferase n=1 Tax=Cytobacillus sp. IB215316 TaxID=3097354 RepID=UPI002A141AA8|nr:ornithine carbamoyltransferase [Cytobacillus sp. IB215316]MDX8361403.1 ornithine carbamoyltransferase [Cytobacillus sp. IB215316]